MAERSRAIVRYLKWIDQTQDTLVHARNQVEVDLQNALIALTPSTARVAAARKTVRVEQQKLSDEQTKHDPSA